MAAQTIRLHVELEVLDPVLALSTPGVELVDVFRLVGSRGDDKTCVGSFLHRLGLVDDPAATLPTRGPVETLGEEPGLLAFFLMAFLGFVEQLFGESLEARVGYESDGVSDALGLAVIVQSGHREACVRPYL